MIIDKIKDYQIILASRSPRRRELLEGAGFNFTLADNYEVDEVYPSDLPAKDVPLYLAKLKSEHYPSTLSYNQIVITADTIVIAEDKVIGKPSDRNHAIEMLKALSGKEHKVITGVVARSLTKCESFSCETTVKFNSLDMDEIEYYVDRYKPYDKAGSYGIQEWIGYIAIEYINGSFYNVMGLPIQRLYTKLKQLIN